MLCEKDVRDNIALAKQYFHHMEERIDMATADVESRAHDNLAPSETIEFNDIRNKHLTGAIYADAQYINELVSLENKFHVALYEVLRTYNNSVFVLKTKFLEDAAAAAVACHKELSTFIPPETEQDVYDTTITPKED